MIRICGVFKILRVIICAQNLCTDFLFHTFFGQRVGVKNGSAPRILLAGSTGFGLGYAHIFYARLPGI